MRFSGLFALFLVISSFKDLNISFFIGLPLPLEPLQQRVEPPSNLPTSPAIAVCSRLRHRWMR